MRNWGLREDGGLDLAVKGPRLLRGGAIPGWGRLALGALLVAGVLAAYYPAIRWGGYVWDDDVHLTQNPVIFTANGLVSIWSKANWRVQFYPMTFTSFWLQYRMSGLNPLAYHLVNVLLHAVNACLLWYLLRKLGLRAAGWIAAVFALHPVNVESVAWVTERKNVLMGMFYFLAALAYLRFEGVIGARCAEKGWQRWRWYGLAALLFAFSLLSKTVSCTFPAGMAVVLWWKRGRVKAREGLALLPLLVMGLGLAGYTAFLEKAVVGSVGKPWHYSAVDRVLIAGRVVWFDVGKFLWPRGLAFSYPLWRIDAGVWWQWVFPAGVVAALGVLWGLRRRTGRGPLAAAAFFLVTISPALGFVDYYTMIYSLVADHYVYIAMIGLAALVVEPLARGWERQVGATRGVRWWAAVVPAVLVVLGGMTWQRCFAYQNAETLWRDTLKKNPNSWLAHTCLGVELRREGHPKEALGEFRAALAVNPDCFQAMNDIGTTLVDLGHPEEAEGYFERVIAESPASSTGYTNLGTLRFRQQRYGEAAALYQKAIALDPYDHDARVHYGNLLAMEGRFGEAAEMFREALALAPQDAVSEVFLGGCLEQEGDVQGALEHFERAAALRPGWGPATEAVRRARQELARGR